MPAAWHHRFVRLMMTLDPLVHDTFNSPLGDTGDLEGHSVIRTENGGHWYADDVSGDEHVAEAHAEIVRRVNHYPDMIGVLKELVSLQDEAACVWRTSPIMDKIRAVLKANIKLAD